MVHEFCSRYIRLSFSLFCCQLWLRTSYAIVIVVAYPFLYYLCRQTPNSWRKPPWLLIFLGLLIIIILFTFTFTTKILQCTLPISNFLNNISGVTEFANRQVSKMSSTPIFSLPKPFQKTLIYNRLKCIMFCG